GTHQVTLHAKFSTLVPAGSVTFSLSGTAVRGSVRAPCGVANTTTDYLLNTASPVSYPSHAQSVDVTFTICGDPNFEGDDTIIVTLGYGDFINSKGVQGTVTITNDDPFPGAPTHGPRGVV